MIHLHLEPGKAALGKAAAELGALGIRATIDGRGAANIIVATGASQFEMLAELVRQRDIDWSRVTAFHLDEYIGLSATHPASFRRYLRERFASLLPGLGAMHYIDGDAANLEGELRRLNALIAARPIDVTFAGIGENGHLAFNDPPADFDASEPYRVVDLDERCRAQQLGEGWFGSLAEVPLQAISMSIRQIMASAMIVLAVPDRRKAEAVRNTIEGPVSPKVPASILQRHPAAHLFLDPESASLLRPSGTAET